METLAYLHLALEYETLASQESSPSQRLKVFQQLNWKQLSGSSCLCLLSAITALAGMSSASEAKVLKLGDNGPDVVNLQQRLQELGYFNRRPTGFFREITKEAVVKFQQRKGLMADGVVGPQTEAALVGTRIRSTGNLGSTSQTRDPNANASSREGVLRRGDRSAAVTDLQKAMQGAGIYNGPVTGYFGSLTEAAVKEFQQSQGLIADGIYGSATRSRLQALSRLSPTTINFRANAHLPATSSRSTSSQSTSSQSNLSQSTSNRSNLSRSTSNRSTSNRPNLSQSNLSRSTSNRSNLSRSTSNRSNLSRPNLSPLTSNRSTSSQRFNISSSASRMLQQGDRGERVTKLQNDLQVAGVYDGPVTGYFGSLTKGAVREFQRIQGLSIDGIAGPATLSALQKANASIARSSVGQLSVLELQKRLQVRGFYQGPLDGKVGPLTERAIAAARRSYGLSAEDVRSGRF